MQTLTKLHDRRIPKVYWYDMFVSNAAICYNVAWLPVRAPDRRPSVSPPARPSAHAPAVSHAPGQTNSSTDGLLNTDR